MATQIGVIKQVSGLVVAIDENGAQRVLKAGDALFLGEVIKTSSAASKAVVSMDNGKDVTILGNESVKLDNSVLANSDNAVADVSDLQKALLDGKDLTKLEETAAGGGNAAAGGGDGVSLGAATFDQGGHYSNISENFRSLGDLNSATGAERIGGVSGGASGGIAGTGADIDTTPANKPSIDPIDNDDTKVTGKVENPDKDTTVTVTFPDGTTATTTVDNNGNWEVPTSGHTPLKPGDTVTATAEDKGGKSDPVNSEVVDVTIGTIEARFVEDGNNDGRLTYQENMSDGNRKSTSLELKVSGSFEDGDKITLHLDDPIKGSGDIVLKKVGNSVVVESASESLKGMAPIGAVAPINNGVIMISKIGMLNGQKTIAKAYITDDAGNKSNVATDEFTYVDRESKPVNVDAGSAIYGSFPLGILLDPNKLQDDKLQPLIGGNDDHSLKVKTITTDANIRFGDGDDNIVVQNLPGKGGFGNILNNSVVNLGAGDNKLEVERDIDKSKIIAGDGDDTVIVHNWVRADATIDLGAGDNKLTVDDQIYNSTVTTKGGNDIVSTNGLVNATIDLGNGKNELSVETHDVTGSKITTGSGDDTIEIGKNVINSTINLGAGDDTIKVGWLGNNKIIDGGEGYDKLALTNSGKTIDLSHIAKQAHNFEEIDISNGKADATLKVSLKDVVDLTDGDNILKISGDKDDAVSFKDANQWIKGTSANGYTSYTGSFEGKTVTVQIEDEIKQPM